MALIKQIWDQRKHILEGIANTVNKKEYIEKIAAERMSICSSCPLIDNEGNSCAMPGSAPCCSACGCKLAFKVRSLSSHCAHPDEKKWDVVLSDEEQDKLYEDINYNPDEPNTKD